MSFSLNWDEKWERARQRRVASFKRTSRQRRNRELLIAARPYCCVCGRKLQGQHTGRDDYANVVGGDRISCAGCVTVAHAQRVAESQSRTD